MLVVIEPLLSSIANLPHENSTKGLRVRFLALVVIVLVSLSDGLLHEYIGKTVSPWGLKGIALLANSLIGPSVITFCWLQGLKKKPSRAARYGLCAAVTIGIVYSLLLVGYSMHKIVPSPQLGLFTLIEIGTIVGAVFFWPIALGFVASGFLGGLAADRGWCRHAWQRIAIGLAVAAAVDSVFSFFVAVLEVGIAKTTFTVWSLLLPTAVGNIGWALGFVLAPDSDSLFQSEPAKEIRSMAKESARFACYAVLTGVCMMAISVGSIKLATFLQWNMVNRALHPAPTLTPLPQGRST